MIAIAAEPRPFPLRPGRAALVVIDMQRDVIEPGGFGAALGNDVSRLQPAIAPAARLLELFRERGWLVIHTRESHQPDLSDCPPAKRERGGPGPRIGDEGPMGRFLVRGEPGNRIVDACAPIEGEFEIDKPGRGAFYRTELHSILTSKDIAQLVFAGVTTEGGVQTTMREAADRGYDCLVVEEATESCVPEFKQATLAMIRAQGGIVGWTAKLADVEAALA